MLKQFLYRYAILRFKLSGLDKIVIRDNDSKWSGYWKLWKLYSWVRRNKPQNVIEYGSGYSTLVIAEALLRNEKGLLVSIDHDPEWAFKAFNRLSSGQRKHVSFTTASIIIGKGCHYYSYYPKVNFDLVYIDGPDYIVGFESGPISADVLTFSNKNIIVDNRKSTVDFLKSKLCYDTIDTDMFGMTTIKR